MRKRLYSVKDNKVGVFCSPFNHVNDAEAIRDLTTVVNLEKGDSKLSTYPEDFDLYYIGEFDTDTGKMIQEEIEYVVNAFAVKKQKSEE